MIYKIGTARDLEGLPCVDPEVRKVIENDVAVLDRYYGEKRDVDNDDGGYVLYCAPGTKTEELREYFNYTSYVPEFANKVSGFLHSVFVLSNEYAVSLIVSVKDAPPELKEEM